MIDYPIYIHDNQSPRKIAIGDFIMLTYSFSDRGGESLYGYLYRCIKEDILNGILAPEDRLPSKRSLAKHLGVSAITIENAYAQLMAEGYIYSMPKKGYYVSNISKGTVTAAFSSTGSIPVPKTP